MKSKSDNAVVNGKSVSGKKPKGLKKLLNMRYGKHAMIALLFVVVGVAGLYFVSAATTTHSLFSNSDIPNTISTSETRSMELGLKFKAKYAGKVTGVKFYKSAQNTGTHTGTLWDSKGNRLATVRFTNETASGWQTATFPAAVNIAANVTYVISYHAPAGHYSQSREYFRADRVVGPLTAPKDTETERNGVYSIGSISAFPARSIKATNFWVDVVYTTELVNPTAASAPPTAVSARQVGNSIVVSWNEGTSSNGITKYRIYKNNQYLLAVGASERSYTDTNVSDGQTYTYQVKTVDGDGIGSVRSVAATVTFNTVSTTCPSGQTGTPPNCVPVVQTCPPGQTGTPPNCVTPPPPTTGAQPTRANTGPRYAMTTMTPQQFYDTRTCNRQKITGDIRFDQAWMKGQTFNLTDCEVERVVVYINGGGSTLSLNEMPTINMDYVDINDSVQTLNAAKFNVNHSYINNGMQLVLKDYWAPFITGPAPYNFSNTAIYGHYEVQPSHTEAMHVADYGSGYRFTNVAFIQQGGSINNSGVTAVINFHGNDTVFDGCWFLWDGPAPTYHTVYIDGQNTIVKNSWFDSGAGYVYPSSEHMATYQNNRNVDTGALLNLP